MDGPPLVGSPPGCRARVIRTAVSDCFTGVPRGVVLCEGWGVCPGVGRVKSQQRPAGNRAPTCQFMESENYPPGGLGWLAYVGKGACAPRFQIYAPKCAPICPRICIDFPGR